MEMIAIVFVGGLILFIFIFSAVKMAVKEPLYELKEEIVKEFNIKPINSNISEDS